MSTWTAAVLAGLLALPAAPAVAAVTPAQARIDAARQKIEARKEDHEAYAALAMAYARRARETGDTSFYDLAEQAVEKSLEIASDNPEAKKSRVWILLGKHEFSKALQAARPLYKEMPEDLQVAACLSDALVELGNYEEAEKVVQWMLDLRPGNVAGLTRGAFLRELFGDIDGAIQFMRDAFTRTPSAETEDRAWILTHIAHLYLIDGGIDAAESNLKSALEYFPDYHYALAQMAKVRAAQGRQDEAVALLRKRYEAASHPENLYELAVALERAGKSKDAGSAFDEFEKNARSEMEGTDNCNRELAFYYADRAARPAEAVKVARAEMERRKDCFTRHAYAWALYRDGKHQEARKQMDLALEVGVVYPEFLYHAGAISLAVGDEAEAEKYLSRCLRQNPNSEFSADARKLLKDLEEEGRLADALPAPPTRD